MVTSSPPALGLACEAAEVDVMAREPVEKGRLLANRLVVGDTLFYGAVSGVLDVLEEHKVNIANLKLGRQDSDLALCLMSVDGQVPEAALNALRALPQLNDVRTARLK